MSQEVYSPKDIDISFGGQLTIDGWDSITISRNSENTSKNISADGRLGLTYSADATGSFEIEVQQQNSVANKFFAEVQGSQDRARKPLFYNITISDKSGGVLTFLNGAFLDMPANQDLTAEATSRTWMFYVTSVEYVATISGEETPAVTKAKSAVDGIKDSIINTATDFVIDSALDILSDL
tara:strand:- start:152 stop:694 length:543 start_codon:yes stop_codon:yes gene_type:complete